MRRSLVVLATVLGVAAGGLVVASASSDGSANEPSTPTVATATATVSRQTLSESVEVNGLVSHGQASELPIEPSGLVTWAPTAGETIAPGDVVVRVSDRPVVAVQGIVPVYRTMRLVSSSERDEAGDRLEQQTGDDVMALERFLAYLGFDDDGDLEVDGVFDRSTRDAVRDWQESVGLARTGEVDRSQVVMLDGPRRVETTPKVGDTFSPSALTVTAPSERVTARASVRQRSYFDVGGEVSIATDTGDLIGTITKTTRTVSDDGTTSYDVEIDVDELPNDVETVRITSAKVIADDVLTVPASALLALREGGWAVEVVLPAGPELTRVELGEVVDGVAEVTGVDEGAEVVVPA